MMRGPPPVRPPLLPRGPGPGARGRKPGPLPGPPRGGAPPRHCIPLGCRPGGIAPRGGGGGGHPGGNPGAAGGGGSPPAGPAKPPRGPASGSVGGGPGGRRAAASPMPGMTSEVNVVATLMPRESPAHSRRRALLLCQREKVISIVQISSFHHGCSHAYISRVYGHLH